MSVPGGDTYRLVESSSGDRLIKCRVAASTEPVPDRPGRPARPESCCAYSTAASADRRVYDLVIGRQQVLVQLDDALLARLDDAAADAAGDAFVVTAARRTLEDLGEW